MGRFDARRALTVAEGAVVGSIIMTAVALFLPVTTADAAPGACPQPVADRYEPGDEVTIIGYTGGCVPALDRSPSATAGALYGYLYPDTSPDESRQRPAAPTEGIPLGQFSVADAPQGVLGRRMSLTFTLPATLAPGPYYVEICESSCAALLQPDPSLAVASHGWPSWPVNVGVDPAGRAVHLWPPDDPVIQQLPDDAIVMDASGHRTTVGDLRSPGVGDEGADSGRADTVATGSEEDSPRGGGLRWVFWGIAAALVAVAWLVLSRTSRSRKRISP